MNRNYKNQNSIKRRHRSNRRGSLLLIVLVTIVILSLSAYTFTALMQTEEVARLETKQIQSRYLVESGLEFARLYLSNSEATIRAKGGRWNNQDLFGGVAVALDTSNPNLIGYFSIATSDLDDEGNPEDFDLG